MSQKESFSKVGFAGRYFLPLFTVFLIPVIGWFFFDWAERKLDREAVEAIVNGIREDKDLSAEEKDELIAQWSDARISRLMASSRPEAAEMQQAFSGASFRYAAYRWLKRDAMLCGVSGVLVFLAGMVAVFCSRMSQRAHYASLRAAWLLLRPFAVLQVVGQGILLGFLSFYLTVVTTGSYYPKLILFAVIAAGAAVLVLLKAVFTRPETTLPAEGKVLPPEDAPALWARVTELCERLGTAKPDHIVVGVDDNFYVMQGTMLADGRLLQGRTLFASLALLRVLTREEADGVLAHEMAHFSGEDTLYSSKTAPLLQKFVAYLQALYEGGVSRPVFYFMMSFWALFQLSQNKISREREFRADRIGAEHSSPRAMANSLLKIGAYCRYRARIQDELFGRQEIGLRANIAERIGSGFGESLRTQLHGREMLEGEVPHPFDSHPPTSARIAALGIETDSALKDEALLEPPAETWLGSIRDADALEQAQWAEFEKQFEEAHATIVALRMIPKNAEEVAYVEKHFPPVTFRSKKETATITWKDVALSTWPLPIPFDAIEGVRMGEGIAENKLAIEHRPNPDAKKEKVTFVPTEFTGEDGRPFLEVFERYYGRHMFAKQQAVEKELMEKV